MAPPGNRHVAGSGLVRDPAAATEGAPGTPLRYSLIPEKPEAAGAGQA